MEISRIEKIIHWIVFLSFLGLLASSLAADFFFSKEAIMKSFVLSLPMVNTDIPPADQLFIARLERRDTWDIHFYFGVVFGLSITIWTLVNIIKKKTVMLFTKIILFLSGLTLFTTGTLLFLRLYIHITPDQFELLKNIHHYGYRVFVVMLVFHILSAIYKENTTKSGVISGMLNFRKGNILSTIALVVLFTSLFPNLLQARDVVKKDIKSDLAVWANDDDYINGTMYLEGKKGAASIIKEISNCPYDKCKSEDVNKTSFGTHRIEIKKPDFVKGIALLSTSSAKLNVLACDKLLKFLAGRIDYKSKYPNEFLLIRLKTDTNLDYEKYKNLVAKTIEEGTRSGKSCYSQYLAAELYENGSLGFPLSRNMAIKKYENASQICPKDSMFRLLSVSKTNTLHIQK